MKYVYKLQTKDTKKAFDAVVHYSPECLLDNILDLLIELKEKNMLSCIVFNMERDFVSKLALKVYQQLESGELEVKLLEKMKKETKRSRNVEKTRNSLDGAICGCRAKHSD